MARKRKHISFHTYQRDESDLYNPQLDKEIYEALETVLEYQPPGTEGWASVGTVAVLMERLMTRKNMRRIHRRLRDLERAGFVQSDEFEGKTYWRLIVDGELYKAVD